MSFITENPSEEDKVKTSIRELKKEYYKKDNMKFTNSSDGYIIWTIDKERDIWFSKMVSMHLHDPRDGYTGEHFFILHTKIKI